MNFNTNYFTDIIDNNYIKRTTFKSIIDYLINNGFITSDFTINCNDLKSTFNISFTMDCSHLINGNVLNFIYTNKYTYTVINT